ncbi:hypothetical protein AB5I41_11090 [Sphingomonas sp. MMS24-JH45]
MRASNMLAEAWRPPERCGDLSTKSGNSGEETNDEWRPVCIDEPSRIRWVATSAAAAPSATRRPAPGEDGRHVTYCRLCEAQCGMIAEVKNGLVVKIGPDRDHPVSRGHLWRRVRRSGTSPMIRNAC